MKKRCYFVYTWKDKKLPIVLKYLKKRIEILSDGMIEVIFDRESFHISDNFKDKEKMILESDCIIIFFSPEYKKSVSGSINADRGANREYQYILKVKEKDIASIITTHIKGNREDAITDEFLEKISFEFDLDSILSGKRGKTIIAGKKKHLEVLARKIVKQTELASRQRDYVFSTKEEAMENLFGKSYSIKSFPQKCMYKSEAYDSVISQSRKYIVGRKGSGKTTFFELLERSDAKKFTDMYKILRPIKADNFNLEELYNVIYKYENDLTIFSVEKRLKLFWEIFIYLTTIYIVCLEDEYCMIEDDRHRVFEKIGDILRNDKLNVHRLDNEESQEAVFISSIRAFDNFLDQILDYAMIESYETAMVANFKIDNVMDKYFGRKNYHDLKIAISNCKKNILLALDGFNTSSEDFRKETVKLLNKETLEGIESGKKRQEFEIYFYRSMFSTFQKLEERNFGIMSKTSLCIIMPQDRIDQIKKEDRDFDKYNFVSLSWDAVDLLEMLVIRLEYIFGVDNTESESLQDRFKNILKKRFKTIPYNVSIIINNNKFEMDLFIYMLRVSIWRPREIIDNFYALYQADKKISKTKNQVLSNETVKDILKSMSKENAKRVFTEYHNVIINIEEIMEAFRDKNIILDLDEVLNILSNQTFAASTLRKFDIPVDKFEILYELGILGLKIDNNLRSHENLMNDLCFNYNEGLEPLKILKSEKNYRKIKVVVNPMFALQLSLNYNSDSVLENYSWKYLYDNHARKATIRRI